MYNINSNENETEKVELYFSCRNLPNLDYLSKTDAKVILYSKINRVWEKIGESEIIWDNLNPDFSHTIILDYYFEVQQYLRVEVLNINDENDHSKFDFVGFHEFELGKIIGSNKSYFKELINDSDKKRGNIIIRYDKVCKNKKNYSFDIECSKIKNKRFCLANSKPFIKIYKYKGNEQIDDKFDLIAKNQWILTYETEHNKKLNPIYRGINITSSKLSSNNTDLPLKLEVWDHYASGSHKLIGYKYFRLNEINSLNNNLKLKLISKSNKNDMNGYVEIKNFSIENDYDIIDYIRSGLKLQAIISIDFTASNGNPSNSASLHNVSSNGYNLYQKAISEISGILLNYDHDKLIPLYGFGFKIPNETDIKNIYPLSFNWNKVEVNGLDSIMTYYKNALTSIEFSGPTYFAPIIKNTIDELKQNTDINEYFILTILTDGLIHDMRETIDLIVEASELPLSIIIIGIGDANFENMNKLDGDDIPLVSSKGVQWKRDIVQFVPFKKFGNNQVELTKEVLFEVPTQIKDYFKLKNRNNFVDNYQKNNY